MAAPRHRPTMTREDPHRRRWTVLEVRRHGPEDWRVTQEGTALVGEGPTAARAAADFCTAVANRAEGAEATDRGEAD